MKKYKEISRMIYDLYNKSKISKVEALIILNAVFNRVVTECNPAFISEHIQTIQQFINDNNIKGIDDQRILDTLFIIDDIQYYDVIINDVIK